MANEIIRAGTYAKKIVGLDYGHSLVAEEAWSVQIDRLVKKSRRVSRGWHDGMGRGMQDEQVGAHNNQCRISCTTRSVITNTTLTVKHM